MQSLPPIYPLPSLRAAVERLAYLEKHIRAADRMLARYRSDVIEEMRVRLEREFDGLFLALETRTEVLPILPKCSACGKVSHRNLASAERHAQVFAVIDKRQDRRLVDVFRCRFGGSSFHVGHGERTRAEAVA